MSRIRYSGALERCAVVILLSLTNALTQAASTTASAILDEVAQGCYAIYAPNAERYLSYDPKSTLNDGYQFKTVPQINAMPMFFKTVGEHAFRIRDTLGNELDFSSTAQGNTPFHWMVEAFPAEGSGGPSVSQWRFRFISENARQTLAVNSDGGLTLNGNSDNEDRFRLVEAAGCNPYNEVFPNVVGDRNNLKGHASSPVRGWMDAHTHISSFMAFGGTVLHGKPFHERGPAYALEDSLWTHGPNGAFDFVGRFLTGDILAKRNTEGWPNFPEWPNHVDRTYSLYYYRWLERSYLSGQRLMVVHLIENEVLCYADSLLSIFGEKTLCNPRTSIKAQARYMHKLEDYIDEQFGGPGQGFFRIVGSPAEARRVIAQGKMAIVLGVEASELFNCGLSNLFEGVLAGTSLSDANFKCDLNDVDRELDALYDLGVRSIFPIHRFDNKFGGTYVDDGIFSLANAMSTGHLFKTEACDAGTLGADINGIPLIGGSSESLNLQAIFDALGLKISAKLLDYDPDINHCNRRGLSPLGVYLVNRMIDKKMLIEVDHASVKALRKMLDIAEARQYSGVVTGHSWTHVKPDYGLHDEIKRLLNMGGFAAPYHSSTTKSYEVYDGGSFYIDAAIRRYLDVIKTTPYLQGVGLGSDISGLGKQVGPREASDTDPLQYPYTNEFGLTFSRQQTGNRVFDLNIDGMTHYGMMPDNIQDIRVRGDQGVYEAIMNSAEAYLQMWERATASTNTAYADTADPFFKIVNRQTNLCVDITGHDINVTPGTQVTTSACDEPSFDQDWIYDPKLMQVQSRVDRSICLDNGGQPRQNSKVLLGACRDHQRFRWIYNGSQLASPYDTRYVASVTSTVAAANVVLRRGTNAHQQWRLETEADYHRWVSFRDGAHDYCMTVNSQKKLIMTPCSGALNQQWYYAPIPDTGYGTLSTMVFGQLMCVEPIGSRVRNGVNLKVNTCNPSPSNKKQLFKRDGLAFKSAVNEKYVLDAYGTFKPVGFWQQHNENHTHAAKQQWHHGVNFIAPWVGLTNAHLKGSQFSASCGGQKVMVGIRGRVGWALDAIGPICVDGINDDGWIGSATDGPIVGPNSGFAFRRTCPAGSALTGLEIWQGYKSDASSLGGLRLVCQKYTAPGQPKAAETRSDRVGKTGTQFAGTLRCTRDAPRLSALSGSHGPYLNSLGFQCL